VTPLAEERGIRLEIETEQAGWIVRGNRLEFRRLLLILLDNALKFTPPNESVRAVVARGAGGPRIEIHDRGRGVAEEHIEHIFERFYRGDTARTSPGFGLGLSIAKAIVEANQGSIGIAWTGSNGSCFYVELPGALVEARRMVTA
jgi:signal transduction histidine kinase